MDILKVPTIIKAPTEKPGLVINDRFRSIDILPTMLSLLSKGERDAFDGQDFFSDNKDTLKNYRFAQAKSPAFIEHDLDIMSEEYDLGRKFRLLDVDNSYSVRTPSYEALIGKNIEFWSGQVESGLKAELENASAYSQIDTSARFLPARIRGILKPTDNSGFPAEIAVAINGRVEGVSSVFETESGEFGFSVIANEESFKQGGNDVSLFEVRKRNDGSMEILKIRSAKSFHDGLRLDLAKNRIVDTESGGDYSIVEGYFTGGVSGAENINDNLYMVKGWAGNLKEKFAARKIVFFHKERAFLSCDVDRIPSNLKPAYAKLPELRTCGFETVLNTSLLTGLTSAEDIRVFALSDDFFATDIWAGNLHAALAKEKH